MSNVIIDDKVLAQRLGIAPPPMGNALEFFFTRWMPFNVARLFKKEIAERENLGLS